jgi:RES domain.
MHREGHGAWWFSSDGSGRFGLERPNGTCYLAETPLGALIEHFDGIALIPQEDLDQRSISTLSPGRAFRLADCTSSRARGFGADLSLSAGSDYERTQRFAAWFHANGFDGVRYFLRNDPTATLIGIALFGSAGEQDLPVLSSAPVDEVTLEEATGRFGVEVVPLP